MVFIIRPDLQLNHEFTELTLRCLPRKRMATKLSKYVNSVHDNEGLAMTGMFERGLRLTVLSPRLFGRVFQEVRVREDYWGSGMRAV